MTATDKISSSRIVCLNKYWNFVLYKYFLFNFKKYVSDFDCQEWRFAECLENLYENF